MVAGFGDPPEATTFSLDRHASALKAGIIAADALSTVSPRYARRFKRGSGSRTRLVLRARSDRLAGLPMASITASGIRKRIRTSRQTFQPTICLANVSARSICCDVSDCPEEPERPIIAIISRLVGQKGYDLIRRSPDRFSKQDRFSSRSERARKSTKTFCNAGTTRRRISRNLQRLRRRTAGASDRSGRRHVSHAVAV